MIINHGHKSDKIIIVIDHDLQYLKNLILSGKATCKATCKLYLRNIAKFIWMEFPL